ncbi:MAG TPA: hypothetical protein VJ252_00530 [Chthoniobacterales bacterium]|nr:hypothetical protein [Chthoniobacterales bacterium]
MKAFCVFLVIAVAGFGYWYGHRPISYPAGVLISSDPAQINLPADTPSFEQGTFHLKPLAVFSIDARVLHRKVYRYDNQAALVPVDLALGWGPMSDQRVLDQLSISQSGRFYWYQYRQPPIPKDQIISHSTNVHIIPATSAIASRCKSLRAGSLIHLSGDLVEATGPGIGSWRSSLSRTDSGNGACELMWVKEISTLSESDTPDRQEVVQR